MLSATATVLSASAFPSRAIWNIVCGIAKAIREQSWRFYHPYSGSFLVDLF